MCWSERIVNHHFRWITTSTEEQAMSGSLTLDRCLSLFFFVDKMKAPRMALIL